MSTLTHRDAPRRQRRAQAQAFIDNLQAQAYPSSQRIYLQGSRADIRVPLREISLSPTLIGGTPEQPQWRDNEAIAVYDTSGAYGDPQAEIDLRRGLPAIGPKTE